MPEITSTFRPAWWLPGPHLPTIWGKMIRRRPPVHDRTEKWDTPDGDHLTLVRMGTIRPGVPHLLILHGLEGRITAKYAHGLLALARSRGWSGDLMMFRSCDGEVNRARRFYHSGETTDLDLVVRRLVSEHADLHLALCGVSLGGNVLLKWLGEQGAGVLPHVKCAAAVSVPYDLEAGARHMESGLAVVYVRHFLRTLTDKALRKMELHPDFCDRKRLLAARTFWDFDEVLTGPVHGFTGAHDYYSRSSSLGFIDRVRVPTLLMSSWDDPFIPRRILEEVLSVARGSQHLHAEFTETGGHVGWVAGSPWTPHYHMEARVIEWVAASP